MIYIKNILFLVSVFMISSMYGASVEFTDKEQVTILTRELNLTRSAIVALKKQHAAEIAECEQEHDALVAKLKSMPSNPVAGSKLDDVKKKLAQSEEKVKSLHESCENLKSDCIGLLQENRALRMRIAELQSISGDMRTESPRAVHTDDPK